MDYSIKKCNRHFDNSLNHYIEMGTDTYGERLKSARIAVSPKLNQSDLAKKVGVGQSHISDLENDRCKGSAHTAQIAHALNVHARWLAEGIGPRTVDESDRLARDILSLPIHRRAALMAVVRPFLDNGADLADPKTINIPASDSIRLNDH